MFNIHILCHNTPKHDPIDQAAEKLPAATLQEYRDIFLYFDRWLQNTFGDLDLINNYIDYIYVFIKLSEREQDA